MPNFVAEAIPDLVRRPRNPICNSTTLPSTSTVPSGTNSKFSFQRPTINSVEELYVFCFVFFSCFFLCFRGVCVCVGSFFSIFFSFFFFFWRESAASWPPRETSVAVSMPRRRSKNETRSRSLSRPFQRRSKKKQNSQSGNSVEPEKEKDQKQKNTQPTRKRKRRRSTIFLSIRRFLFF